ncbi:DUF3375 domain-containing protein [Bifidobacterium animalis]|uniref:DUF3375 domain-containing protein n=1 Tax=Bifidobacterium animalis TaxID=28025 RepID=UPI00069B9286|nr:DUF3375 domain-containing protein [Bifidobacterium animalis]KOA56755.1 hypothetical protein BAAA27672_02650 [Bifidobacterium animalis subsp. animalis ATCC 27672]MCR1994784.1 DUF3375 domain-containing protein [Bifidobacterium animalis subsp. animalis]
MADVRSELAQLRPVYETGVLRMLLHKYSDIYIAMLRVCFDPLTAEVPQERLLARMREAIGELAVDGTYTPREGEDDMMAARRILKELKAEDAGDYAWVADSIDRRQHRLMCRLTQRAHRAIEALATLQQRTVSLSGAQVNSIIMEIESARKQLTVNVEERIDLLEREIEERQHQIDNLKAHGIGQRPTREQVSDIINVVYNTLRGVPVDLRELVITERDNGDALRRRIDDGSMSSNDMLTFYHEEYERTYRLSDEGRRFNDAFQVMYAPQSREELNEALQDISNSEWLHGEADDLMSVVNREFEDIYDGIDDVRHQIRVTDESVKLLVRQQTDMQFRTMSRQLAKLFTQLGESMHAKDRYDIGTATTSLLTLPTRARETPVKTVAPELQMQADDGIAQVDLNGIVAAGGPRIHHMIELVAAHPVLIDDAGGALADSVIDIAASFNELPADERRESEIVGFLSYLGSTSPDAAGSGDGGQIPVPRKSLWHCVTTGGRTRVWRTCALFVPRQVLKDFLDDTMVED